jgi:protein-disulfide isomerase
MKRTASIVVIMLLAIFCSAPAALAEARWRVDLTLKPDHTPIDLLISPHKEWLHVLDDQGWISIYATNGELKDKIHVGADVRQIKAGPRDNVLFLLSRTTGTIRAISIDFVEKIDIGFSPVKGRPDAPVTVTVFSDFQCPYCARLVPVLERLIAQYPGKVKLVFKNFPIRSHAFSIKAAEAALAAHQQGKFWAFHDLLFKNYNRLNDAKIAEIASHLGLNDSQFQRGRNDPATLAQINADASLGRSIGVHGTPTVFVNGRLVRNKSAHGLKAAVDEALGETATAK